MLDVLCFSWMLWYRPWMSYRDRIYLSRTDYQPVLRLVFISKCLYNNDSSIYPSSNCVMYVLLQVINSFPGFQFRELYSLWYGTLEPWQKKFLIKNYVPSIHESIRLRIKILWNIVNNFLEKPVCGKPHLCVLFHICDVIPTVNSVKIYHTLQTFFQTGSILWQRILYSSHILAQIGSAPCVIYRTYVRVSLRTG